MRRTIGYMIPEWNVDWENTVMKDIVKKILNMNYITAEMLNS
jgi:hypothetical protein